MKKEDRSYELSPWRARCWRRLEHLPGPWQLGRVATGLGNPSSSAADPSCQQTLSIPNTWAGTVLVMKMIAAFERI